MAWFFGGRFGVWLFVGFVLFFFKARLKATVSKAPLSNLAAALEEECKPKLIQLILLLHKQNHRSS